MKAESPRRDELRVLGKTRGGGRNMVGSRAAVRGQSMEDFKKREFRSPHRGAVVNESD